MMESGCVSQNIAHQYWCENHFKCEKNPLYNGGILYGDRESITNFYKNVPQLGEWMDYYKKYNLHTNVKSNNGIEFNEQNWLSYFFHQQNIDVHDVALNWGSSCFWQRETDDFVHYTGPHGKYVLEELGRKEHDITFYV